MLCASSTSYSQSSFRNRQSAFSTPGRYRWQLDTLLIPGGNSSLGTVYKKHWNGIAPPT